MLYAFCQRKHAWNAKIPILSNVSRSSRIKRRTRANELRIPNRLCLRRSIISRWICFLYVGFLFEPVKRDRARRNEKIIELKCKPEGKVDDIESFASVFGSCRDNMWTNWVKIWAICSVYWSATGVLKIRGAKRFGWNIFFKITAKKKRASVGSVALNRTPVRRSNNGEKWDAVCKREMRVQFLPKGMGIVDLTSVERGCRSERS